MAQRQEEETRDLLDYVDHLFWCNAALIWVILVVPCVAAAAKSPGSRQWWPIGVAVVVLGVAVLLWGLQPRRWEKKIQNRVASIKLATKPIGHVDELPEEEWRGEAYEEVECHAREVETWTCICLTIGLVAVVIALIERPEYVGF